MLYRKGEGQRLQIKGRDELQWTVVKNMLLQKMLLIRKKKKNCLNYILSINEFLTLKSLDSMIQSFLKILGGVLSNVCLWEPVINSSLTVPEIYENRQWKMCPI